MKKFKTPDPVKDESKFSRDSGGTTTTGATGWTGVGGSTYSYKPRWWEEEMSHTREWDYVSDGYTASDSYYKGWGDGAYKPYKWGASTATTSEYQLRDAAAEAADEVCRITRLSLPNKDAARCVIKFGNGGNSPLQAMADALRSAKNKLDDSIVATLNAEWIANDGNTLKPETSDALVGESLIQSNMQENADRLQMEHAIKAYETASQYNRSKEQDRKAMEDAKRTHLHTGDLSASLYTGVERSESVGKVTAEWPGFAPYFRRAAEKSGSCDEGKLKEACSEGLTADAIVASACHLLSSPGAKPDIDPAIITAATDLLEKLSEIKPRERFDKIDGMVDELVKAHGRSTSRSGAGAHDSMLKGIDTCEGVPDKRVKNYDPGRVRVPEGCMELKLEGISHPKGDSKEYDRCVQQMAYVIRSLKKALEFRRQEPELLVFGCRSGDFDEGAVQYLASDDERDPAIWHRSEEKVVPRISLAMLVDESGSMCGGVCSKDGSVSPKYVQAQLTAIALYEAFKDVTNMSIYIYGHTSHTGFRISEYLGTKRRDKHSLSAINSHGNNADGFAMEWVAKTVHQAEPQAHRKIMFTISDGQPAAYGYGGEKAITHCTNVVKMARQMLKTEMYGIGVGMPAYVGEKMYGKGKFICLDSVIDAVDIISAFMKKVCRGK